MTSMDTVLEGIATRYGYSYTGYKPAHGIMCYTAVHWVDGEPKVIRAMDPRILAEMMRAAPCDRKAAMPLHRTDPKEFKRRQAEGTI